MRNLMLIGVPMIFTKCAFLMASPLDQGMNHQHCERSLGIMCKLDSVECYVI